MNNKKIVLLLTLSTLFLGDSRFVAAQRFSESDLQTKPRKSPEKSSASKFIRLQKGNSGKPDSLQTSITRYQSEDGRLLVDLIGVVHVGEESYYRKLNRQFEQYDSLLYELVAPPESRVPTKDRARESSNPISWLQSSMKNMLGLESQLAYIDYTKSNFVHADLSPHEMQKKMAERGDTAWTVGLRAVSEMMKNANAAGQNGRSALASDISSFEDLFGMLNDPRKLKIMMAQQFTAQENLDTGLGSTLNQLLITDRNQAAMKVLKSEIEKGQTKIGIFYGAAHMPDFEKRLVQDFGLRKTKQAWVEAWDLESAPQKRQASGLTDMMFRLIDSIDQ